MVKANQFSVYHCVIGQPKIEDALGTVMGENEFLKGRISPFIF